MLDMLVGMHYLHAKAATAFSTS